VKMIRDYAAALPAVVAIEGRWLLLLDWHGFSSGTLLRQNVVLAEQLLVLGMNELPPYAARGLLKFGS